MGVPLIRPASSGFRKHDMMPRDERLARIRDTKTWDLVVIGGGATGLGTALEAATRGYSTLLLEASDYAKGTSSRSTKLVHGGVRYLAQGNVSLVREALRERGRLLRNAPHLVHQLPFLIPSYSLLATPYYGAGLWLYDRLAGSLNLDPSRAISKAEAIERIPTIEADGLRGGILYQDGQFDDARLAIALLRSIDDHGGTALNYVSVDAILKTSSGKVAGVRAKDAETGESFSINAKGVINATGVFADEVRRLDDTNAKAMIAPSQGAHLVVDARFLPGRTALMVPKTDDGRVLFAIPWHDRVIIGTTDTPVPKVSYEPKPLEEEIEFLLAHAKRYFSPAPKREDILSVYAGLRPLISQGNAISSRISREHATVVSSSGMITITGGKWTTYRKMGEDAVNLAAKLNGLASAPSVSANLPLHGWVEHPSPGILGTYGSDLRGLQALIAERPEWSQPIHPALPYVQGELVWAIRFEAARTVEDLLARRTRALFLDAKAAWQAAPMAAELLASELERDSQWITGQLESFKTVCEAASYPAAK